MNNNVQQLTTYTYKNIQLGALDMQYNCVFYQKHARIYYNIIPYHKRFEIIKIIHDIIYTYFP